MATQKKIIGRLPVSRQEYAEGTAYYRDNIVTYGGSAFQCTADGTTTAPAVFDDSGNMTINAGWKVFADASAARIAEKKVSALDTKIDAEAERIDAKVDIQSNVLPEALASLAARVDALESSRGLLGNATAGSLDVSQLTKCLYPVVMKAHGVPAEANVPVNLPEGLPWDGIPAFVGQLYVNLDAASGGLYYAVGTDSVNDWKQA